MRLYTGINTASIKDRRTRESLKVINDFLMDVARALSVNQPATSEGSGGIPDASYLTVSSEAALSSERRLVTSSPLTGSDSGPNGTFTLGLNTALLAGTLGGTPAILYGTTFGAGSASTFVRTDAQLKYPTALLSSANSTTLTLTDDGTDQFLDGSLGVLNLRSASAGSIRLDTVASPTGGGTASVLVRPGAGSSTFGLQTQYVGANLSSYTVRGWNVNMAHSSQLVSSTFVGYDQSTFSLTASAGSDNLNTVYGARFAGPLCNNANAGFTDVGALYLIAPRRIAANPTVTQGNTLIVECPTIGSGVQAGIYLKQRTAQQTATERVGLLIDTQNSGTTRRSMRAADQIDISSQAAQAQTVLTLHQLATGATAGAHINFDDKAGDPPSPVTGDLWRNGDGLWFRQAAASVNLTAGGGGGGDNIRVNSTAVTDADLEDLLPVAPTASGSYTGLNVKWQLDTAATPDDISAYVGKDLNGNWMLAFRPIASAVNYVGITNSVTGIGPTITANGTDANIDLNVAGGGVTGRVMVSSGGTLGSEVTTRSMFSPLAAQAFQIGW